MTTRKVLITGSAGLLGKHAQAVFLALNGAAKFHGKSEPWVMVTVGHEDFLDDEVLKNRLSGVDLVLHFAGINRASDEEVEFGNIKIAERLCEMLKATNSEAHVIYANSTHSEKDIPYGRGKAGAAAALQALASNSGISFTNVILPHVFGEGAKPFYNNVTATLCQQIVTGETPTISDGAAVELLHSGEIIDLMLEMFHEKNVGEQRLKGTNITVPKLFDLLSNMQLARAKDEFPSFSSKLDVALFQCLQSADFPNAFVTKLKQNADDRGTLFETARGGGGGQTFLSWTHPGVVRGNHFHRYKVERFVVVHGEATIRMRNILNDTVHNFAVSGKNPVAIDMPSLHTHSIENTGEEPLLTMFWAHEIFDPNNPDTWACEVRSADSNDVNHKT